MDDAKKVCTKADFREYQPFRGEPEVICWTCGVPKDKHRHMTASGLIELKEEYDDKAISGLGAGSPTPVNPIGSPGSPSSPSGVNSAKTAFYHFLDRLNLERSSGKNPHTAYVDRMFLDHLAVFIITQSPFPHTSVDHLNSTVCIDKVNVLPNALPYGTILFY